MAIQLSMDICVLVFKDLYKDYINTHHVGTEDAERFSVSQDNNLIKVGNVENNGNEYTVCVISKADEQYNYPYISDFAFDTKISFNSRYDFELTIERDLKLTRSKETPSGFNLSEYLNGEITEDMTHHDFFSSVIDLLVENEDRIVKSLLNGLTKEVNHYMAKLSERITLF